jgi:MSHA biogenesis protein MshO
MNTRRAAHAAGPGRNHQRAFTLVELVVVIVLTAIVMGFALLFLSAPVDAYYAQSRRAGLVESSDAIKRWMAEDLRKALPNSVRVTVVGTRAILEMLVADQMAFYDANIATVDLARKLEFGTTDTQFAVAGLTPITAPRPYRFPPNFRLAVGNMGDALDNAYQQTRVQTDAGTQIWLDPVVTLGEERIRLMPGFKFTTPSLLQRLYLVSGPVAYICNSAANAGTLRRYATYDITQNMPLDESAAQLNAAGATSSIVARDISACSLRCANGAAGNAAACRTGLVVDFTVARATASGNETMRVLAQFPMDNQQ